MEGRDVEFVEVHKFFFIDTNTNKKYLVGAPNLEEAYAMAAGIAGEDNALEVAPIPDCYK